MSIEKSISIAEEVALDQLRRWPALYPDGHTFFLNCVIGTRGSYKWKDGLLVLTEDYSKYPYRISREVAIDLLDNVKLFPSVSSSSFNDSPIKNMPDDMHPEWQSYIGMQLFTDKRITPDLYQTLVEAFSIVHYGTRNNPHAPLMNYRFEWEKYWNAIPNYEARLQNIREFQTNKKIPLRTFIMAGI